MRTIKKTPMMIHNHEETKNVARCRTPNLGTKAPGTASFLASSILSSSAISISSPYTSMACSACEVVSVEQRDTVSCP